MSGTVPRRQHHLRSRTQAIPVLAAVLALGCTPARDTFVRGDIITAPVPERFSVCHGHGCRWLDTVGLTPEQWLEVRRLFEPPAPDAAAERRRIATAVAYLERLSGARTGTAGDLAMTRFDRTGPDQLDCIDESTNTTTYLRLLESGGLLRHHAVAPRATRGLFIGRWPHTTAVIREIPGATAYAVDSWFHPNGAAPEILPLEVWRDGWRPGP